VKSTFIIIGFIIAGFLALALAVVLVGGIGMGLFLALKGEEPLHFLVVPISFAFAIGMLVEVVAMERTRNVMKVVMGADF
jgi:hypothetical protein